MSDATARAALFGPRLRELREAAGLTQAQLAERAGLHPQGVVKLERGERAPGWETVIALADALAVTCQDFLTPAPKLPQRGPGRPPKAAGEPAPPKRPRGRPPKAAGTSAPPARLPARGRKRRRKDR